MIQLNSHAVTLLQRTIILDNSLERQEIECVPTDTSFLVGNRYWMFVWDKQNAVPGVERLFRGKGSMGEIKPNWVSQVFPKKVFYPCEEAHPAMKHIRRGVVPFICPSSGRDQVFKKEYIVAMYNVFGYPALNFAMKTARGKDHAYLAIRSPEDGTFIGAISPILW